MLPRSYFNEEDARKRHIETLKVFNEHVEEIQENTEYRIDFSVDDRSMSLQVILPPEFPDEQPRMYLNPTFPHPWLAENSNQVVGAPGLTNYSPHSDLGRIVQVIIREFQRSVPALEEASPQHIRAESVMFPAINGLTIEELREVLENTDLQDRLIESNLRELDQEAEEVLTSIEEIAEDNLEKKRMLDEMKTEILDRISNIVEFKTNFDELNRRHQEISALYEPRRIQEYVKDAALEADEEAENIAEKFLLGHIPVEEFISQFTEKRALGQARRAREERLGHQLRLLDRAT